MQQLHMENEGSRGMGANLIDESVLEMFKQHGFMQGDPKPYSELLTVFFTHSDQLLPELFGAMRVSNIKQVEHLAHRIRGGARNIGALRLGSLLEDVESRARGVETEKSFREDEIDQIQQTYYSTRAALERYC